MYNVAAKDIGRKLKCKKCSTALMVTEAGLEIDGPQAVGSKASPAMVDDYGDDDAPVVKKKKGRFDRGPGGNPLAAIGGIPTVLFGFGVFLVIVFTSLPIIGAAGSDRATAYVDKLKLERDAKIKALEPKKKQADWTSDETKKYGDDAQKVTEDYDKKIKEAVIDAEGTKISNRRDVWMERYGLMFGFIFVAFGCLGYLRSDQPLTLRIVAAVILGAMMLIMFGTFGIHGCGGRNPLG